MQPTFWINAWEEGNRGFHLGQPNARLVKHAAATFGGAGRILVPLCGATHDLQWLVDQGYEAVGAELSPLAVRELAEREGLAETAPGRFTKPGMTVLLGDFFALTPEEVGPITGLWDRAALVAMHPDQRVAYVAKQRELLGSGSLLLNVLSYDAAKADGPPWSVDPAVVAALWPEAVELTSDTQDAMPRFAAAGIAFITAYMYSGAIRQ